MLARLYDIDWNSLAEVSGSAVGIPRALRLLMSESEMDRKEGYWRIDNHVVVQSDLYPAAPYVVPFLLEMLCHEPRPGAALIYDLLFEIGNGAALDSVKTNFRLPEWPAETLSLQAACRKVVESGLDLYLKDVRAADVEIRAKAIELVEMLADKEDPSRVQS